VFNGETKITGAISYVTDAYVPAVYALTGHGEAALSDKLSKSVAAENMDVESLDLISKGSVPEDAAAIMIVSPQSDISKEERELLAAILTAAAGCFSYRDTARRVLRIYIL
jgi:ABC-2 type transport system permease protein